MQKNRLNIRDWWKQNSGQFLRISELTGDILPAQPSSVASGSAFLIAWSLVTDSRSRLCDNIIHANICLNSWTKLLNQKKNIILKSTVCERDRTWYFSTLTCFQLCLDFPFTVGSELTQSLDHQLDYLDCAPFGSV